MNKVSKHTKIPLLKVCGMKHNVAEVAQLDPDYVGFIFYEGSPRNYTASSGTLPNEIKKVGVFVNASIQFVLEKVDQHAVDVVQLHGNEDAAYLKKLKEAIPTTTLWKVFSIKDSFDFNQLKPYEPLADAFLFDTKGPAKGGNGRTFNWEVLTAYASEKPLILSGGIGLEEIPALKKILSSELPIVAIDINSKFEITPGIKDIKKIKQFIKKIEDM